MTRFSSKYIKATPKIISAYFTIYVLLPDDME